MGRISATTHVLVRRRVNKSEDVNCLSVAGGDEVCVIRAERQAVDVDEPDLGGGGGYGRKRWSYKLHLAVQSKKIITCITNQWFGMGSPHCHGTCVLHVHELYTYVQCTCKHEHWSTSHLFIPLLNSTNFSPRGTLNTRITVPWRERETVGGGGGRDSWHWDMYRYHEHKHKWATGVTHKTRIDTTNYPQELDWSKHCHHHRPSSLEHYLPNQNNLTYMYIYTCIYIHVIYSRLRD